MSSQKKSENQLSPTKNQNRMNRPEDCPRFESCSALCPLADNASDIWYPDEEICSLTDFRGLAWVRRQKKFSRMADPDYYFTLRMLQQNCIIKKGIYGLDPDHEITTKETDENKWLKAHPEKREITEADKQILRDRMLKVRQGMIPV